MGTNVGQRGPSQTGTVWPRRWSLRTDPDEVTGGLWGGPLSDLRTTGVTDQE